MNGRRFVRSCHVMKGEYKLDNNEKQKIKDTLNSVRESLDLARETQLLRWGGIR
jgi:hypothetical protein